MADALAEAHAAGIVHRDIKPENILLAGKHAVVADFGIAKAISDAGGRRSTTSMGLALGTPAYMSPEQATADPGLDHRADLHALGIVGYEMLTGHPPFSGTGQEILAAHTTKAPEPLANSSSSGMTPTVVLPAALQRVSPRARLVAAGAVLLLLAGGEAWLQSRARTPQVTAATAATQVSPPPANSSGIPDIATDPSIAVLPFENMSSDVEQAYFSDGITEELLNLLAKVPRLRVIARTSSFAYKDKDVGIAQIARELQVAAVLEGSVRRSGDKVRITVQLIRARDGTHLTSCRSADCNPPRTNIRAHSRSNPTTPPSSPTQPPC